MDGTLAGLECLNRVGLAINRSGTEGQASIGEILRLAAEGAVQLIPGASASSSAYDPNQGMLDTATRVDAGALDALLAANGALAGGGLCERALAQRRLALSYESDPAGESAACQQARAAYPLLAAGEIMGVLYVGLSDERRFSELELLLLGNLANQAAMAIHRVLELAVMQRDLTRKEDELARLQRAGLLISSRLRLEETLEAILTMALEVMGAHYGVFRLVDRTSGHLVTKAIAGDGLGRPHTEPLPIGATSIITAPAP